MCHENAFLWARTYRVTLKFRDVGETERNADDGDETVNVTATLAVVPFMVNTTDAL